MGKDRAKLTGKIFNRWTVLGFSKVSADRSALWNVKCQCGNIGVVSTGDLKSKHSQSCGCLSRDRATKHGMSKTLEYRSWSSMMARCCKPKATGYDRYGGRGIKVCDRWLKFENFFEDMGQRPSKDYSIEREDNDGNYEPSNCKWATRLEQCRNKKNNRFITYLGETKNISGWAEKLSINASCLIQRLNKNWSVEKAFTIAVRRNTGKVKIYCQLPNCNNFWLDYPSRLYDNSGKKYCCGSHCTEARIIRKGGLNG